MSSATSGSSKCVFFIAGDPSGDVHAAEIVKHLSNMPSPPECIGVGGPHMQAQGFRSLLPFEKFNRMGFKEVLIHLPFFLSARARIVRYLHRHRPAVCVLVDYPGFNIPIMKAAKKTGIPVIWYIVPQVWAWKKKRSALLGRYADTIATIFPFESRFFASWPAKEIFVGHPLVEEMEEQLTAPETRIAHAPDATRNVRIALLPGSRSQEVRTILPVMTNAAARLKKRYPGCSISISRHPQLCESLFGAYSTEGMVVTTEPTARLLAQCDLAVVTSGTATLQTALMSLPMVIVYKTSFVTYMMLKKFITLPYIGLPNIVAGREIVPECIQNNATGAHIANHLASYIESSEYYRATVRSLSSIRSQLGEHYPSRELFQLISGYLGQH